MRVSVREREGERISRGWVVQENLCSSFHPIHTLSVGCPLESNEALHSPFLQQRCNALITVQGVQCSTAKLNPTLYALDIEDNYLNKEHQLISLSVQFMRNIDKFK